MQAMLCADAYWVRMLARVPLITFMWALIPTLGICFCRLESHGQGSQGKKRRLCPEKEVQLQPKISGRISGKFRQGTHGMPLVRLVAQVHNSSP